MNAFPKINSPDVRNHGSTKIDMYVRLYVNTILDQRKLVIADHIAPEVPIIDSTCCPTRGFSTKIIQYSCH